MNDLSNGFCNLNSQQECTLPETPYMLPVAGGTQSPPHPQTDIDAWLIDCGYRAISDVQGAAEGFTPLGWQYVDLGNGLAQKQCSTSRATADIEAEAMAAAQAMAAAAIAAEAQRQIDKPSKLKTAENEWLKLCDAVSGGLNKTKLSFEEIKPILEGLEATQPLAAAKLMGLFLGWNTQGTYYGGDKWWDDITWHPEMEA